MKEIEFEERTLEFYEMKENVPCNYWKAETLADTGPAVQPTKEKTQ